MSGMNSGIYLITCTPTGSLPRYYVGQSVNIARRIREHVLALSKGLHVNPRMLAAWKKYGSACFKFETLEIIDRQSLDDAELWWLSQVVGADRCMNILATPIGGSLAGHLHYAFGKKLSAEHRARISRGGSGATRGDGTRMAISRAVKGSGNPMFGRAGAKNPKSKPVSGRNLLTGALRHYESARLAEVDGFSQESISRCCNGMQKSHLGFSWVFAIQPQFS